MATRDPIPVHAVVRYDSGRSDPRSMFTVKEILPTAEEAIHEVERLNELDREKGRMDLAQYSRYYPEGRQSSASAR